MIIDFHTHIFPPTIQYEREKYFSQEPAFKLLYDSPKSKMAGAEALIDSMDQHRIDKSVVFGFPWKNPEIAKAHNDYIMNAVVKYNKRLIGFCSLDPFNKHAVSEANRCIESGISGIGEIVAYLKKLDKRFIEKMTPLMALCLEKNLPVLLHSNEPIGHNYPGKIPMTIAEVYELVKRFRKNKIILAHWGGGLLFFHSLKKEVKAALKNVYYDTAASPYLYDPMIYSVAVRIVTPEKILFGSDFPLLNPDRYFDELATTGLSRTVMKRICGLNAASLLGIKI
ncbi:MAG: amidohydrolase family protein [Deltaproteobacteria bacterium]|nr:amidohydrolase family protein [Deltaproteobacteria bacterium]